MFFFPEKALHLENFGVIKMTSYLNQCIFDERSVDFTVYIFLTGKDTYILDQ